MLREMAVLAGRINKHKRIQKQKEMAEEKRLLRELAMVSGLINKRKRGEDTTPACTCLSYLHPLVTSLAKPAKRTQPSAKRRKIEKKVEQCVYFAKFGMYAMLTTDP